MLKNSLLIMLTLLALSGCVVPSYREPTNLSPDEIATITGSADGPSWLADTPQTQVWCIDGALVWSFDPEKVIAITPGYHFVSFRYTQQVENLVGNTKTIVYEGMIEFDAEKGANYQVASKSKGGLSLNIDFINLSTGESIPHQITNLNDRKNDSTCVESKAIVNSRKTS